MSNFVKNVIFSDLIFEHRNLFDQTCITKGISAFSFAIGNFHVTLCPGISIQEGMILSTLNYLASNSIDEINNLYSKVVLKITFLTKFDMFFEC